MYQYALEKLKKDLEEQRVLKNRKKKELKQIMEKLENIEDYDDLLYEQFRAKMITVALLIMGLGCGIGSIGFFINLTEIALIAGIVLDISSIGFLFFSYRCIKEIKKRTKEIKALKKQGVKKFRKHQKDLEDKELELKEENSKIQHKMDEIIKILEHIDFVKETANDIFYQADTQEEYENVMKQNCLLMWNEFLNEKIDYSRIQLDEVDKKEAIQIRKLTK